MRQTSTFYDLRLMSFITFISVIGSRIHILSTSASPMINTKLNVDAANTTSVDTVGSTLSMSSATMTLEIASTSPTTFTPSPIYSNLHKTSITMNGRTRTIKGAGSTGVREGMVSMSSITNGSWAISSATTKLNAFTSTSKLPFDYALTKKWTGSDAVSFHPSSPMASATAFAATPADRPRTYSNKHHHEHHWGPFFEEPINSTGAGEGLVTTAHLYTEAALNCRVGMLKDKTVMWVRRTTEKVSLLTVGNITYSGDPRIRVKFQYPNNWRLLINPTQKEDAGIYMCQVSTHPPRVFTTNLTILEPPLRLIDDQEREVSDRYYKAGSTIDLYCQVSRSFLLKDKVKIMKSLQPYEQNQTKTNLHKGNTNRLGTGYNELVSSNNQSDAKLSGHAFEKQFISMIFWAKDEEMLPSSAVKRSSTSDKWLISRVSIPDAKLVDSGNYSCSIGRLFATIVQVQVLTGDHAAKCTRTHPKIYEVNGMFM
ncbi:uncharacterized protein dpr18 isoform X2 [Eurosta solidaginis]|uniref:uncharacterized protein dpr18 isoform X2 n=1 Tax=Eurosta solidaginis TaxID=178769 RepID=UPI0035308893